MINEMKSTVSFRVSKECYSYEEIAILGNIPELGNWAPDKCLILEKMDYDQWEGSITIKSNLFEIQIKKYNSK